MIHPSVFKRCFDGNGKRAFSIRKQFSMNMFGMPPQIARSGERVPALGTFVASPVLVGRHDMRSKLIVAMEHAATAWFRAFVLLIAVFCLGVAQQIALVAELAMAYDAHQI